MRNRKNRRGQDEDALVAVVADVIEQSSMICRTCRRPIGVITRGLHCPSCGDPVQARLAVDERFEIWQDRSGFVVAIRGLALFLGVLNLAVFVYVFVTTLWFMLGMSGLVPVATLLLSGIAMLLVAAWRSLYEFGGKFRRCVVLLVLPGWTAIEVIVLWTVLAYGL